MGQSVQIQYLPDRENTARLADDHGGIATASLSLGIGAALTHLIWRAKRRHRG
jgi:hypothetical protein